MSPKKISPAIPLAVGVLCIGAALVGGILAYTQEAEVEQKPKAKTIAEAPARRSKKAQRLPVAKKPATPPAVEKESPSPDELRRQTTRILLGRIAKTPTELNEQWFAQYLRYIRTEAHLDTFFAQYLTLGQQRSAEHNRAQLASKKLLPQDPRYFVGKATSVLIDRDNTEKSLIRGVKENMAQALYKEQEEAEGLENVDEAFMGNFFKKLLRMYGILAVIEERDGGKADRWLEDHVRTLEAAGMDRYMRVQRRLDRARQKKEGTSQSAAGHLFRIDRLDKAINENMLLLGKVYHQAAAREVIDREKHQSYANQAFYLLAMIYQRAKSGEALNVMREVNDIQRDYLHRLARVNWKRAQLAMAAGEVAKADERFFIATQRYLQAMSQAVGGKREEIAAEFAILKKEIVRWKSRGQGADAAAETQL